MIAERVTEQRREVVIEKPLIKVQGCRSRDGVRVWRWPINEWSPFAQISAVDGDDLKVKFIQDRKEAQVKQRLYASRFGSYDF